MKKLIGYCISLLISFSTIAYAKDIDKFIGVWKYVSSVSRDGSKDKAFIKNSVGYLIYTKEGIMSVEIMSPNRAPKDFFAYSGHFFLDEKQHIVTHYLEIAVLPSMVGKNYQRYYHFKENFLYLTVVDSPEDQTLIWQKISYNRQKKRSIHKWDHYFY